MTVKTLPMTDELHAYVVAHGTPPDEIMRDLIEETERSLPASAQMQVAPEQAAFLSLLTKLVGARHVVEIGTFTGLSSLAMARGLVEGGKVVCFDISDEFTSVARRYWERAGVSDRIDLRIGPAAERLRELPTEAHLDLSFIDADKTGYPAYWEELVPRTRPGGLIVVDNVLRDGRVLAPRDDSDKAIVHFNDIAARDERVEVVMLPIADGLTLARRR
ncbi:class I SAM-dependent methyltransferase [Phytohabitans houttuyneae]|uniref:O-methyltransferase n=1 Tax=Phytohabitans houttuyneae TaxID=1076126 RepID=UPI0031F13490